MPGFIWRFFKKPRLEADAPPLNPIDKLNETLERLEGKEKALKQKASQEVEKAKEAIRERDKRAAIQCLKRKRLYEQQIKKIGEFQLKIHEQIITLEGAGATTETVDALITGAAAMEAMKIDDLDNVMDRINEQLETTKQMQEAVSAPSGAVADFDEDELEAELEELEAELAELEGTELEEQLLLPAATASAVPEPVIAGLLPAPPAPQGSD